MPRNLTSKTWVSSWWKRPSPPRPTATSAAIGSSKYTRGAPGNETGSILAPSLDRLPKEPSDDGVEPGHTLGHRQAEVRMLLSFQRPSPPGRKGFPSSGCAEALRRSGQKSIATSLAWGRKLTQLGRRVAALTACRKVAYCRTECVPVPKLLFLRDPNPCKPALSELKNAPVHGLCGQVEHVSGERLTVELDSTLAERPPRLRR
jgi:hypothetical protein